MSRHQPLVSVIIPAYNVTAYITETLDSVFAQTFRDFEIILINDESPDTIDLERALEPYRDRIIYLKQANSGPSSARNRGIRASSAPLIAFLDGDDLWEPEYLDTHVKFLAESPDIDLVYPNAYIFTDKRVRDKTMMNILAHRGEPTFRNLVLRECHVYTSVTARREAVIRAGLFDEKFWVAEDFDLWLRMALAGSRLAKHSRPLAWYRRARPDSLSRDPIRMLNGILAVYNKLLSAPNLSPSDRQALEEAIRRETVDLEFHLGKSALYREERGEALERLKRANRTVRSRKISVVLWGLRLFPEMVFRYVHRRYPTERSFLNHEPGPPVTSGHSQ